MSRLGTAMVVVGVLLLVVSVPLIVASFLAAPDTPISGALGDLGRAVGVGPIILGAVLLGGGLNVRSRAADSARLTGGSS